MLSKSPVLSYPSILQAPTKDHYIYYTEYTIESPRGATAIVIRYTQEFRRSALLSICSMEQNAAVWGFGK